MLAVLFAYAACKVTCINAAYSLQCYLPVLPVHTTHHVRPPELDLLTVFRELENMAHGGRPLPSNPALARPPILWAEDFVAIAGSLPLMDPQGGLKPLPESGPYVQPVSFQGATALHLASFYGHLGVTDLLLAAGACAVTATNIQVSIPIVKAPARSNICTCLLVYVMLATATKSNCGHAVLLLSSMPLDCVCLVWFISSPCQLPADATLPVLSALHRQAAHSTVALVPSSTGMASSPSKRLQLYADDMT